MNIINFNLDCYGKPTQIAWETEIWICEMPSHMIHFNGDRFIGPR
ncbi:BsuBI/PstI family type II restriction endonuclease [Neptunitalea chrysea]|nr:BsuBI/PstI family type II restriction endonuclease [Neptunitalea chrysea]